MSLDTILFIGFGFFLVLIFAIIYIKDAETNRKFERFARAIDDANRQNHHLTQLLSKQKEEDRLKMDELRLEIHKKIQEEINSNILPLLQTLEGVEDIVQSFHTNQQDRLDILDERTKMINHFSVNDSNEKRILQAYESGKRVSDIAKDLRIGIGEVELVLRMNALI